MLGLLISLGEIGDEYIVESIFKNQQKILILDLFSGPLISQFKVVEKWSLEILHKDHKKLKSRWKI